MTTVTGIMTGTNSARGTGQILKHGVLVTIAGVKQHLFLHEVLHGLHSGLGIDLMHRTPLLRPTIRAEHASMFFLVSRLSNIKIRTSQYTPG